MRGRRRPDLSIIVIAYDMAREIPRTLQSLSRAYQRDIEDLNYEVLVVDNGSPQPLDEHAVTSIDPSFRLHRIEHASPSPAQATNLGVSMTSGRTVCLIMDGARMVTPGMLAAGMRGLTMSPRAIATPMAWHLGPEHQSVSLTKGYGPEQENALLTEIAWPSNGYRLFEISVLAGANLGGFFGPINESCCLFLPRALWEEVDGADEAFDLPGGGYVTLDLFARLVGLPATQLVVLLGEGSFHQVHGGVSTSPGDPGTAWRAQYKDLRGIAYRKPVVTPLYVGGMPEACRRWLQP